ncbi:MAG: tetratricopeptide repeat protein [Kiloniellales bacterium]
MKRGRGAVLLLAIAIGLAAGYGRTPAAQETIPRPGNLAAASPLLLEAVRAARAAVAEARGSAAAWGALGNLYLVHDWVDEAARCYRRAIEIEPTVFRWHYYLGISLGRADPTQAADAFARAIALDESYAPAHVRYAENLTLLGRFEAARRHFERAAELDPQNPYSALRLGELALAAQRFERARDHLRQALALNPRQREAHAALAKVYMALGNREAAGRHALEARKPAQPSEMRDPLWVAVQWAGAARPWYAARGAIYLRERDFAQAVRELEVAVAGGEQDPEVWLNYGTALIGVGRDRDARAALQRALAATRGGDFRDWVSPENLARLHTNLGAANVKVGDAAAAERHLRQALTLDPARLEAINNLAVLVHSQGRLTEAVELLQRARRLEPDATMLRMLAAILRQAGDPAAAAQVEAEIK